MNIQTQCPYGPNSMTPHSKGLWNSSCAATILMSTLGHLQEHCWLASKNCRTDNGWILTRELSSLSLKGFRDEEVADVWCISAHFGVTLNGRENSYVVPTWCSQPFLLMGSNSTSMKLPTSRSDCLPPHGPAAFWYFLTSLLRLPFTTKPHNCFHPYDMTLSVLSTRDPHFSG